MFLFCFGMKVCLFVQISFSWELRRPLPPSSFLMSCASRPFFRRDTFALHKCFRAFRLMTYRRDQVAFRQAELPLVAFPDVLLGVSPYGSSSRAVPSLSIKRFRAFTLMTCCCEQTYQANDSGAYPLSWLWFKHLSPGMLRWSIHLCCSPSDNFFFSSGS